MITSIEIIANHYIRSACVIACHNAFHCIERSYDFQNFGNYSEELIHTDTDMYEMHADARKKTLDVTFFSQVLFAAMYYYIIIPKYECRRKCMEKRLYNNGDRYILCVSVCYVYAYTNLCS